MAYDLLTKKFSQRNFSMGEGDPLVWTPAAVRSELLRVLGLLDTANVEASSASRDKKISPEEWKLWRQSYDNMHAFLTTASNKWGSNALQAQAYDKKDIAEWRKFFLERGGKTAGPGNLGRGNDKDKPLVSATNALILFGGIASAGYLISALKK